MSVKSLWLELVALRDEIALQSHLLSLDLKDLWEVLCKQFSQLEQKLENKLVEEARSIGQAEEAFFVGDEEEIKALVEAFKDLKQKSNQDDNSTSFDG